MVSVSGRRLVPKGKRVNASAGLRTGHNWLWRAVTKPTTVATGIRADCGPSSGRVAGSAGERHYRCIRLCGKAGVGGRTDTDRVPRLRPAGEFTQTARSEPTAATEMPWHFGCGGRLRPGRLGELTCRPQPWHSIGVRTTADSRLATQSNAAVVAFARRTGNPA